MHKSSQGCFQASALPSGYQEARNPAPARRFTGSPWYELQVEETGTSSQGERTQASRDGSYPLAHGLYKETEPEVDAARKPLPLLVSGWARRSCLIHWGRCCPAGSPLHRPQTQGPSPPGTPAVPVGGEGTGKTSTPQLLNPKYPPITSSWRNWSHPLQNTFEGEKTAGEA